MLEVFLDEGCGAEVVEDGLVVAVKGGGAREGSLGGGDVSLFEEDGSCIVVRSPVGGVEAGGCIVGGDLVAGSLEEGGGVEEFVGGEVTGVGAGDAA